MTALGQLLDDCSTWLIDLDGTLIDSGAAHAAAFLDALWACAPQLVDRFDYRQCRGQSTRAALAHLPLEPELLERVVERKQASYRQRLTAGDVAAYPYAGDVLEAMRARGDRCVLVTSASTTATGMVLAVNGWDGLFDAVVTCEAVAQSKPHPAPYVAALAHVPPQARGHGVLALEDSPSGMASASAAGLTAIRVHGEPAPGESRWLSSLEELWRLLRGAPR